MTDTTSPSLPVPSAVPTFLGLDFAQWAVILREIGKAAGAILVTTGVYSQADVNILLTNGDLILKGLQYTAGGALIAGPILFQIVQRRALARIADVAKLPNVKGVVTDHATAQAVPDANVVSTPDELKGITK